MSRRNPSRQARYEADYYADLLPLPPPSPVCKSRINTPNTNRKRAGGKLASQPPAKRQSNATASIDPESASTIGSEVVRAMPRSKTNQATSRSITNEQTPESIERRIEEYKSSLQTLKAKHDTIFQDGNPRAVSRLKELLATDRFNRETTITKLSKIKDLIRQVAKAINNCHDVVPAQLHQALQASVTDRDSCEAELRKIEEREKRSTQLFKVAVRKDHETDVKLEEMSRQMDRLKWNVWMAEQDLINALLQQRLGALSRIKVSKLTYDQRLQMGKFVGQVTTIVNEGSGNYAA
ncbi:hypothetical protein ACHAP8_007046 [Fusarium lateritium]